MVYVNVCMQDYAYAIEWSHPYLGSAGMLVVCAVTIETSWCLLSYICRHHRLCTFELQSATHFKTQSARQLVILPGILWSHKTFLHRLK